MSDLLVVSYVALWVLVVLQTLILLGLTRAFAETRGGVAKPPSLKGRPVPTFSGVDLAGNEVSTSSIAGRAAVLLFVSPTCASCRVTLAVIPREVGDTLTPQP